MKLRTRKPNDFIKTMQNRTSVTAVGPSALRGQGVGVLKATQAYLATIHFSKVPKGSANRYVDWLDFHTEALLNVLPIKNRPWGAARKAINLFMRDMLYNQYLSKHYAIDNIEPYLELPLDSAVAKGLKEYAGRGKLPQWPGLKNLHSDVSQLFQDYATDYAIHKGIARVHLDVYLWTENR